jgi:hypothetical protein
MVYITRDYWVFRLRPSFYILKNTTFRKLDLFPSSGCGRPPSRLRPVTEVRCWVRLSQLLTNGHSLQIVGKNHVVFKEEDDW